MDTHEEWSDEEVLARIRSGDIAAYEIIIRRYDKRLFRVARAILKADTDAEDVVQNAFIQAYTHLHQFEGKAAFSTWLTRIAVHEAFAMLRRSDSERVALNERRYKLKRDTATDPERHAFRSEMRGLIERAIDNLPARYRIVFVLREIEELTTAETAACLDISEDNVKIRLHRSRAILRRELYASAGNLITGAFGLEAPRCDRIVKNVLGAIGPASAHSEPTVG